MAAKSWDGISHAPGPGASGRIRKLAAMARWFGWRRSLTAAALWILRQTLDYRAATIYCLDLVEIPAPDVTSPLFWDFRNPDEVEPALWRAADIEGSEQAVPRGVRCFTGSLGGQQCYLSLVSSSGFSVPGRIRVSFAGGAEAYVGNCVTLASHRGMGIYPRGLAELGLRLRDEGFHRLYLFVERDNLASIRGVEKAGFQPVAVCSVLRWLGRPMHRWKNLPGNPAAEMVRRWSVTQPEPIPGPRS